MKVTKPKSIKQAVAAKSGKSAAGLPLSLKKKLERSRGAGLVLFEENDPNETAEMKMGQEVAIAAKDPGKPFNIRLAESPLDVYRSPHLIDLSRRGRSAASALNFSATSDSDYAAWPGGDFLAKYHILDFWDWRRSEIIIGLRKYCALAKSAYSAVFCRPEFAPLLIGEKQAKARQQSRLEEIAPLSLILFFADFYYKIYLFLYKSIVLARLLIRRLFSKDETIWLPKNKVSPPPIQGLLDRLIATGSEPTISELLKPAISPIADIQDGKFKIINYSPNRKKEIREKYLAGNFTRKGVVANPQPSASFWPKDSLSWDLGNFIFSPAALKPVAVFLGVAIALVSSVKLLSYWDQVHNVRGRVMGEAEQALSNIDAAAGDLKSMRLDSALDRFAAANANFISAQNSLAEIKSFLTALAEIAPAENTFKSGTNILDMGEHLSNAASQLLGGVTEARSESDLSLASRINNFSLAVAPALGELKAALDNAGKVGLDNLSVEQKSQFIKLKAALPEAIGSLKNLQDTAAFAVNVLGDNDVRRYLLVFQNDNELRATGGFMGSFALVDLRNGQIEKITIPEGGTYDVRAGLAEAVAPPEALRLVANRWEFQDSNWWPDFPTSAKNIKWFYEKSGGPTIDGVIAVNSSFLGKLLSVVGPINLPRYGKIITPDNFEAELQKSIELEATEKTKPKKILGELAPLLMEKLVKTEPRDIFNLAEALGAGLRQRDIQLYFSTVDLENFASSNNWSGGLDSAAGSDFLSVNTTNIAGGKTDNVIRQKIYQTIEIKDDGTVLDRVLIERRHIGPIDDYFTALANNSYIRVYVPQGSELIEAKGFKGFTVDKFKPIDPVLALKPELAAEAEAFIDPSSGTKVYNENGQTVFANWSVVGPGETRELLLVYKLPFKVSFNSGSKNLIELAADYFSPETAAYSWKFQKQSGRSDDEIMAEVVYPDNLNLKSSYPESTQIGSGKIFWSGKSDVDKFLVAGFTKK